MARKSTLADVAERAGVGSATVDRVLNERGSVREDVRRRVIEAARDLDLKRHLPPLYRSMIRINLILGRPYLTLLNRLGQEFRHLGKRLDTTVQLHTTALPDEEPETIARAIDASVGQAIIVYAQAHRLIHDAITRAKVRGVPTVTIVSDLPDSDRLAYAGTDHLAAGRTAGFFFARMLTRPGPIVVLCNQPSFHSHAERIAGLRDALAEYAPDRKIARVIEGRDDRVRSQGLLEQALTDLPNVAGIYNVGAANLAVRAAIEARCSAARPMFIGHELTEHTAQMLRDGVITLAIDQSPALQAQFALAVVLDYFGYEDTGASAPYHSSVPVVLYGPENIPGRV